MIIKKGSKLRFVEYNRPEDIILDEMVAKEDIIIPSSYPHNGCDFLINTLDKNVRVFQSKCISKNDDIYIVKGYFKELVKVVVPEKSIYNSTEI